MYLLGLFVAAQLVAGQVLWKIAVKRSHFELSPSYLFSKRVWSLIFSPYLIFGLLVYAFATLLYVGMLSKYEYSSVQAIVVPTSLLIAFLVAYYGFHEKLSGTNIAGVLVLIVGIILVTRK